MTRRSVTNVEATYRVTTPMFCGGADPARAELRLPSFKGVLRFWWRALAWRRLGGDLAAVRHEEAGLFGSADGGQSRVLMRLGKVHGTSKIGAGELLGRRGRRVPPNAKRSDIVGEGVRYLGYGVMGPFGRRAGRLERSCLAPGLEFTVRMRCRDLRDGELGSLRDALVAVGMLGGMGAKSRKGFGSLALRSLLVDGRSERGPSTSPDELYDRIRVLHGDSETGQTSSLPPITAISTGSRHLLVTAARATVDAVGLLDLLGREQVRYRSWGHNGKVLGRDSERNFREDHDLMKLQRWQRGTHHPTRIAFGLPHNYGRHSDQHVGPAAQDLDRRASPLFIHIHECGSEAVAVVSFFPAEFLPKEKGKVSVGGRSVPLAPATKLYRPIHRFLDRLLDGSVEPITAKEVRL